MISLNCRNIILFYIIACFILFSFVLITYTPEKYEIENKVISINPFDNVSEEEIINLLEIELMRDDNIFSAIHTISKGYLFISTFKSEDYYTSCASMKVYHIHFWHSDRADIDYYVLKIREK